MACLLHCFCNLGTWELAARPQDEQLGALAAKVQVSCAQCCSGHSQQPAKPQAELHLRPAARQASLIHEKH